MNPRCFEVVSLPEGRGKPPKFCSAACRDSYYRDRSALIEQIEHLQTYSRHERGLLAKLRWHLLRYPSLEPPATRDDTEPTTATPADESKSPEADEPASPSLLTRLIAHTPTAEALAGNPETPQEILLELHNYPLPAVRTLVAANPQTPVHVLAALCRDPSPRVRESAARNPQTPNDARAKVHQDRSRRVREAAAEGHIDMAGSRRAQRLSDEHANAMTALTDPATFVDTLSIVLTHTLADALGCTHDQLLVLESHVRDGLQSFANQRPRLIPVAVTHEWLTRDLETSLRNWPDTDDPSRDVRSSAPIAVPSQDTWIDAFADYVTTSFDEKARPTPAVRSSFTRVFDDLQLPDPLTEREVRLIPRLVLTYARPTNVQQRSHVRPGAHR